MSHTKVFQALLSLLTQEQEVLLRLGEVLRTETQHITQDAEKIEQVTEQKVQLLVALDQFEAQRQQALTQNGLSVDKAGMQKLIAAIDRNGQLQRVWEKTLALLDDCNEVNILNANIIAKRQHQVRSALSILYGQRETHSGYSATGQSDQPRLSRPLAKV